MQWAAVRKALRSRAYRSLLGAQAFATVGHQVAALALPTLAITLLHATAFEIGVITALTFLPTTLFGVFAGVAVDRLPRRLLMVIADAGRATIIGAVALATTRGLVQLVDLYAAAAACGLLALVFDVSYQSHVPDLVDAGDLPSANAALEVNRSAGTVAGPALSGALIETIGLAGTLWFAATALLASVGVLRAGRVPDHRRAVTQGRLRADLKEGLAVVFVDRRLLAIGMCTATSNLGAFAFWSVGLVFVYRTLHMSPGQYGLVAAIGNIGVVLGAMAAAPLAKRFGVGPMIFIAAALIGAAMSATPLAAIGPSALVLAATLLVTNFSMPVYGVNQVSLRQSITPRALQGRMNAVMRTMALSTVPLGSLAGGAIASATGPVIAMLAGGLVATMAPLWLLGQLVPVRRLSQKPAAMPSTVPAMSLGRS